MNVAIMARQVIYNSTVSNPVWFRSPDLRPVRSLIDNNHSLSTSRRTQSSFSYRGSVFNLGNENRISITHHRL